MIYFHTTFRCTLHPFPYSAGDHENAQVPVGLIAQMVDHSTDITVVSVQISSRPEFFTTVTAKVAI